MGWEPNTKTTLGRDEHWANALKARTPSSTASTCCSHRRQKGSLYVGASTN
ncbi:hypothetical protein I3760_05G163800 [Carya illinoinensis]|nr:hypothetical protein I3760_05G163800 [Carya illinoinensis]